MKFLLVSLLVLVSLYDVLAVKQVKQSKEKDMLRRSIVFDKNTPDVFYCPTQKPTGFDKMMVRSRPLNRLCEFEGKPIPADYKSDCYKDVDESDYACKEKYRIMMRQYPPGSDKPFDGARLKRFLKFDKELPSLPRTSQRKQIFLKNRLGK